MKKYVSLMLVCICATCVLVGCNFGGGFRAPPENKFLWKLKTNNGSVEQTDAALRECGEYNKPKNWSQYDAIGRSPPQDEFESWKAEKEQCMFRKGYRITNGSKGTCAYSDRRATIPACQGKDVIIPN
jgi:hypothetical protein